jgi:hypothetical protein
MGVPKFFRWLSERFPLINQTIDFQSPGPIFGACEFLVSWSDRSTGSAHGPDLDRPNDNKFFSPFLSLRLFVDVSGRVNFFCPPAMNFAIWHRESL